MRITLALVARNLTLYFRDIGNVAMSLLSAGILIGVYVLFLGRMQIEQLVVQIPTADLHDVKFFVTSWVFAGTVMIVTFTTAIGALGTFVDDRSTGRFAEFRVAPIRRHQLVLGYQLAAFIISVVMSTLVLATGSIAIMLIFGESPHIADLLAAECYVLLLCLAFSALASFIMTFVKGRNGFTAVSVTVGALLGFVAGAYLPIGELANEVATALNVMPFSPAAMLLREPLSGSALSALSGENDRALTVLADTYGFDLYIGDLALTPAVVSLALVLLAVLLTVMASFRLGRSIERRA